jgi:gas vesicle protein
MPDTREGANTATGIRAFAVGAAVGAVVTLLCAPARGKDTRSYLTQAARNGRERAQHAARAGREAFARQRTRFDGARRRTRTDAAPAETDAGLGPIRGRPEM